MKIGLSHFLLIFMACLIAIAANAAPMTTKAKQAIVVDVQTGQVLFEHNADERMPTSSMSKVMTAYAVFEALKNKKITLDDEFLVSEKAWKKGGSKMFVEVDKRVRVEDLLRGVLVQSGNDATIVLAEGLAGDEDFFAEMITDKAHQLGMMNSQFKNASGWPDPDHYSTARDLSTLAIAVVKNFPEYYHYFSEKEFTFSEIAQKNRNPLIYRDIGADGFKTGHTEVGGYGLMGSGVHEGRRVVMVVNGLESARTRAQEGARLLEWGLKRFVNKTFHKAGEEIASASLIFAKEASVPLAPADDIVATVPNLVMKTATPEIKVQDNIQAPIKKGDQLGEFILNIPNQTPLSFSLYAVRDVAEKGFFGKMIEQIPYWIGQKTLPAQVSAQAGSS